MTEWIHDPGKYTEWCLNIRRMLIAADNVLEAAKEAEPGEAVTALLPTADPRALRALAEAMQGAARSLRDAAGYLDQAVETGFADAKVRPIAHSVSGPERPQ